MSRTIPALIAVALAGCSAHSRVRGGETLVALESTDSRPAAPPLDRSLFAPRGSNGLTEADIARILDAPLALKFPARVGVAALGEAFQPVAPATLDAGLTASRALSEALEGTKVVDVATEVTAQIPTGGGVEGLRELAARYRAPYLVLYSERFEDRSHANGWAALWFTIVGGLLTPSVTVEGVGVLQASLLDVRTGTILFTIQEPVSFHEKDLPIGAGGAWRTLCRQSADKAAQALAQRVVEKFQRIARAAEKDPDPAPAAQREGHLELIN